MSTKNSKDVKQIKQQTPTPMRKMEDPSLWHVMPSRSTRKQQSGVMKPPPPKRKKIVLDEDEYLETMGKVIERDYFPDLDKCRTHYEYLQAIEQKDFDRAERLKYHLLVIQKNETPGRTPMVTPNPKGMTPKAENDVYHSSVSDDSSWIVHDVNNNEVKIPSTITIGKLSEMITSEDNQNFQEKQEAEQRKLREKLWWLYDGEDPDKKKKLMLCSEEEMKMLEDESVRHSWPHRAQNALMFEPRIEDSAATYGVPLLTDSEVAPRKMMVVPANTRLHLRTTESITQPPSMPVPPEQQLIATPAPEPGVDVTPLVTWGSIDGTPLSLGTAIAPLDMPITPLPQINKREKIAEKVYRNMKKVHHASKSYSGASPAAQKLQQRLKGKVSDVDSMLRRSYTPGMRTPSQSLGMTPGMTPGMKKHVTFVTTPSQSRSDKKVVMKKSVTDDLL